MIQRFRIGNNLSVIWLLYEDDGNIHNLEGKNIELYMACGGYKYPVTDYTVTENAVAWVFPAAMQTKTGYYKLVLIERDPVRGLYSYDVSEAFCLEPKDALTNIETIVDEDATVQIKSVLTYAHITNLASVDTVETEDGTVAEIHLTNGKTFTIPLGSGGGGGVTPDAGSKIVVMAKDYYPDYDRASGSYYFSFDREGWSYLPSVGDIVWYFGDPGFLLAWKITEIRENEFNTSGMTAIGTLITDEMDIMPSPHPINNLFSTDIDRPLSANMGRELKRLIDNIDGGSGGSVTIVDDLVTGGRTKALSAEQGKVLKALIDAIPGGSSADVAETMFSSEDNPGTPATNAGAWHSTRTDSDIWIAVRFKEGSSWGEWTVIFIGDITLPYATFTSFAFTRSNAASVSAPSGGSYESPVPTTTGWSDGIPSGDGAVWMSIRKFASDNTHSDSSWSTPRIVADSGEMDYEFSSVANPGTPSKTSPSATNTNPNWSNTASENTIWMAMREVSNGLYKTGSSWMIVKIKGEDGRDGSSVNIKGSVSSVSELPATGNTEGDGYLINGYLYVWDGDSWENVGQIKGDPGEDGQTPYIHIKYSNDGGLHFTGSDGEEPGDYIGLYWDYDSEDSASVLDYTWKYWKGQDGFGYEYIFKLTADGNAPDLPTTSTNVDDYIPTGWTDDPGGVSAEMPFCWVAWRKKDPITGWSAWHGTSANKARLYSHFGTDGETGERGQAQFKSVVFMRAASAPSRPGNSTIKNQSSDPMSFIPNPSYGGTFDDPIPYGWSDGIPVPSTLSDPDALDNTLWMTSRVFTDDGLSPQDANWKTPVRATDADDVDIEFAYQQTNDATPPTPTDANRHGGSDTQVWYDPVLDKYTSGTTIRDFTDMYWMAVRHKINGVGVGAWAIMKIKGEKGTDGVDGKDAKPVRIRKWSDISGQSLTDNEKVFSGYEDGAPFRDVIVITKSDYPSSITYPFKDGNNDIPVLVTINYSNSYSSGYPGSYFTSARLPQSGNYSTSLPASKTASASATANGIIWSMFANLGAVYIQLLVAAQAYIGGLTVDHLTTNAGNESYIDIDDGFIRFYDSNGVLRAEMGQGDDDTSPVLKFYDTDGVTVLYDLGPDGIRLLGVAVYPETWTPVKFWAFNSLPSEGQTYSQASGTPTWLNQYTCARRTINNVVEYYANGVWQNTASPNEGKYYQGLFTYPADGYYVIDVLGWVNSGTNSKRAAVIQIATVGGAKTYKSGHIDLKNIDQDAGTTGTVDEIKWDN